MGRLTLTTISNLVQISRFRLDSGLSAGAKHLTPSSSPLARGRIFGCGRQRAQTILLTITVFLKNLVSPSGRRLSHSLTVRLIGLWLDE